MRAVMRGVLGWLFFAICMSSIYGSRGAVLGGFFSI